MKPIFDGAIKIKGVHFALHYKQPPIGHARVDYLLAIHAADGANVEDAMEEAGRFIGMTEDEVQKESSAAPSNPPNPQT